jgi:hypothetical protein
MRKVIVCNIVSLDGYYAGPDDNIMITGSCGLDLRSR